MNSAMADSENSPQQEEQLFHQALELDAAARDVFLRDACAGRPLLEARLRALLRAHGSSAGFLERPAAARLPADPELFPGCQVGRYALLREIGEGACGVVFRARQLDPIQRDVALKVIKRGMDTRDVVARFEAERQALALLDHPHIARVFDAGATESGRPFFVMELVEGTRITRFADDACLPLRARLELFAAVCDAVSHAHQKGVIHRDLKPSNILVALRSGQPAPTVIDFGVAKATSAMAGRTLATNAGTFLGTPGYLSPEQAAQGAAAVDTRTDVYSLGALLHELLVGEPPFGRTVGPDLLRRLHDEDPPRLSARLRHLAPAELAALAAARHTTPRALLAAVRGDLDAIVQRCLARERDERYASVRDIAEDIRRHLAHEPVRARPPGFGYIVSRLARKHRALAATIAIAVLLLAGTTAISLRLAWAASRAEERATAEMQTKQRMLSFLHDDLFAPAAQQAQPVWDLRWRGVLDRAAERIEGRFSDQPRLASDMHATLGASYLTLGDYPVAQNHLELALFHLRASNERDLVRETALLDALTRILLPQAKLDYAYRLWREHSEQLNRAANPVDQRLHSLRQLAAVERERRRFAAAESHAEAATNLAAQAGAAPIQHALNWELLATIQRAAAQYEASVTSAERALAAARAARGPDAPASLQMLGTLAMCQRFAGRRDAAEQLYLELIERRTRLLGAEHPDTLTTLSELSFVYQDLGRYADAVRLAERDVEVKRRVIGPEHPVTLGARTNLAFLFQLAGRYADAVALHRDVLATRERVLGRDHFINASSLLGIGTALRILGRSTEAEPALRRAVELRAANFGADHRDTLLAETELASSLTELERFAEAEALLRRIVAVQRQQDADGWNTAVSASRWGGALLALGRHEEAEQALLAAIARLSRSAPSLLPPTRTQLREAIRRLTQLYASTNRPTDAATWNARAREFGVE